MGCIGDSKVVMEQVPLIFIGNWTKIPEHYNADGKKLIRRMTNLADYYLLIPCMVKDV